MNTNYNKTKNIYNYFENIPLLEHVTAIEVRNVNKEWSEYDNNEDKETELQTEQYENMNIDRKEDNPKR